MFNFDLASLNSIIFSVLGVVVIKISLLIKNLIEQKIKEQFLARIFNEALETVIYVSQTVGDYMKEAAKDGKLSEDEKATLKKLAVDSLKRRLADIPSKFIPDLQKRIEEAVEAAVKRMRKL